mgnify:CR=1 FL=1
MKVPYLYGLSVVGVLMSVPFHGASATESKVQDVTRGDPFFYTSDQMITDSDSQKALVGVGRPSTTHSKIPHLPVYSGYMNTNYTYRFANVAEQVFTLIGEGKHGLWRVQESGFIREYRKAGAQGLEASADINDARVLETLQNDYAAFIQEDGWKGYKYPDERLSKDGRLNYVDLPITHPKYAGRYDAHDPIDLSQFYCTMSEAEFPYAFDVMRFAFQQPGANVVGPLGRRAGLDVRENYTNVLRVNQFPDARAWVNTGVEGKDELNVNWEAIDTSRTDAEYYVVERPFFNKPYLFVTAVFSNKENADLEYVRPDGDYYKSLGDRAKDVKTDLTHSPRFSVADSAAKAAVGLPIYGVHHPDRAVFGGGGACPLKGGDWGRYPDTSGGSGWPTQYEEVPPLCDAVLVDIKFYSNLDGRDWSDPLKYLANAGTGSKSVTYKMKPGTYGVFTDPYNVAKGVNPSQKTLPETVTLNFATSEAPVSYNKLQVADHARPELPAVSTSCRQVKLESPK